MARVAQWATVFFVIALCPLLVLVEFTTNQWITLPATLITGGLGGYVASALDPDNRRRRRRAKNLGSGGTSIKWSGNGERVEW